jgi:N-acetylmuramoyl-L-alanine amidase
MFVVRGPQIRAFETAARADFEREVAAEDRQLAAVVGEATQQGMATFDSAAHARAPVSDKSSGKGSLWVLRDPGNGLSGRMCRSALLEVEYISNPTVEQELATGPQKDAHRDAITQSIARALANAL